MKKIALFLLIILSIQKAHSQTAEDSVKATITKMFAAMKSGDGTALRDCFADSAILQTITRSGAVRTDAVSEFISQISKLPKDAADERIRFETVKVDDALAVAWTPYQFYYDGKFSHCGVNSFQLVRLSGQWKIQYIIDTRRRNNCQ